MLTFPNHILMYDDCLQAGLFDPYSDDPRLGIKKMEMCAYTGTLVVAGTAGQVLILNINMEEKELIPEVRIIFNQYICS